MSGTVFLVVLLAAVLHAGWNASVRGTRDRSAGMLAVVLGQGACGLACLPFAAMPAPAAWPWILGSTALHLGYQSFLIRAYRIGDLTQVYPIARGISPLLVALGSALAFGTRLEGAQLLALVLISGGIASISLVRRADGLFQGKAALFAVGTGVFIASYSLVDAAGGRIAGTALGYYGWIAALNAAASAALAWFGTPGGLTRAVGLRRHLALGGGASFAAYALVVWAFTQAPVALVTALRETSVIVALVIGVALLGERLSLVKVLSTFTTLVGAVILRLAR